MSKPSKPILGPAVALGGESAPPQLTEQQRLQMCGEAISAALREYGCEIRTAPQFTAEGRVVAVAQLTIVNA